MTWATPAEASALTGHTITQSELAMAQGILVLFTGPVDGERLNNIRTRDRQLLRSAVAYQAAWMQSKPELFGRSDMDNIIQDSLQFSKADRESHIMAPLAKVALMKLSWQRSRTIDPLTPEQALARRNKTYAETQGLNQFSQEEDAFPWEPM